MFLRGINYDVGTYYRKGELSRPEFDESVIKKELGIIRNELHCDAVKITGYDVSRLSKLLNLHCSKACRCGLRLLTSMQHPKKLHNTCWNALLQPRTYA